MNVSYVEVSNAWKSCRCCRLMGDSCSYKGSGVRGELSGALCLGGKDGRGCLVDLRDVGVFFCCLALAGVTKLQLSFRFTQLWQEG